MQVGVRLRGDDAQGKAFDEESETLAINAHGALILMQARVTSGSKVRMYHNRTAGRAGMLRGVSGAGARRQSRSRPGIFFALPNVLASGISP